jgi:hypothetical protein
MKPGDKVKMSVKCLRFCCRHRLYGFLQEHKSLVGEVVCLLPENQALVRWGDRTPGAWHQYELTVVE